MTKYHTCYNEKDLADKRDSERRDEPIVKERDNRFVKNAAILSVAGIFVRALGAIYRIPLARFAGEEIMGLYQMAYPIYTTLLAISISGPPIAVAKMVAERVARQKYRAAQRVFLISMLVLGAVGLLSTIVLMSASPYLVNHVLGDKRALGALLAMAPAVFFVALMSGMRGYFQGLQHMVPYAISQIVEQVVRVGIALGLGFYLLSLNKAPGTVAAGISSGVSLGGLAGLIVLLLAYSKLKPSLEQKWQRERRVGESGRKIMKEFATLAIPITIGGIVLPFMQLIDAGVVPRRLLAAGFTQAEATGLYGQLSGMATPLINLPQMFTVALVASLIPSIAAAISLGQRQLVQMRSVLALKLAMLINLPAAVGLSVLATPIGILLYGEQSGTGVGFPLSVLAYVVAFLAVQQTTSGILQGLGKTYVPVINLFFGALAKLVATYFLTAMPALNIRGSALSTVIGFAVSSILNYRAMRRVSGISVPLGSTFIRPSLAAAGMGVAAYYSYSWLAGSFSNTLATLFSVALAVILYGLLVLLMGALTAKELAAIPKIGKPLSQMLLRLHLIREG
ncbi:MAG TPA: polysaccharide biosynthesis protein [Firmicutes bacterium]|nr:polysaccharide biosynthesis protein [Bacillota bacterium]